MVGNLQILGQDVDIDGTDQTIASGDVRCSNETTYKQGSNYHKAQDSGFGGFYFLEGGRSCGWGGALEGLLK